MPFDSCTHEPWKGDRFEHGLRSRRVLLLGESHYAGPETKANESRPGSKTFTSDAIRAWALGPRRHRFFTKIPRLFGFDPASQQTRDEFWACVAFYNYIQEIVGDSARIAPTENMWVAAAAPFNEVIEQLRPERVVVFGRRLWDHLPCGTQRVLQDSEGLTVDVKVLHLSTQSEVLLARTDHPSSSRFTYGTWTPKLDLFLRSPPETQPSQYGTTGSSTEP